MRRALFAGLLLSGLGGCALLAGPVPFPDPHLPAVHAVAETEPVNTDGDAADDPAVWVDRRDPARSLIVASQKRYGVLLYDLKGKLLQSLPAGRINNVDLRDGFVLDGREVALVAGSNRSDASLDLWVLDPDARALRDVADGVLALGLHDPYGLCLYRSPRSGDTQVFVNDKDGRVQQWRLVARANGRVGIEKLREFRLDTQPEGCAADDTGATLFLGEEGRGVWVLGAEPGDDANTRTLIDHTGTGGQLVADVEGMSLLRAADGAGYLVVSSQGEHAYAVYDRSAPHRYRGKFAITDDLAAGIDGAQETDGLDLVSADLGGVYTRGLLVVQDGYNTLPAANQNFKLVPWSAVEKRLSLLPPP